MRLNVKEERKMEKKTYVRSVSSRDRGNRLPASGNVPYCAGKASQTKFEELHTKKTTYPVSQESTVYFFHMT